MHQQGCQAQTIAKTVPEIGLVNAHSERLRRVRLGLRLLGIASWAVGLGRGLQHFARLQLLLRQEAVQARKRDLALCKGERNVKVLAATNEQCEPVHALSAMGTVTSARCIELT